MIPLYWAYSVNPCAWRGSGTTGNNATVIGLSIGNGSRVPRSNRNSISTKTDER